MEQLNLGTEKIGKLLRKFAIPCIISMVVNALYNMVDQIFIGWGVGYLGNGATNIVFPIVVICLAFSLMFGDGTSAFLSLRLGEKKKKEAEKGVGSGITAGAIVSLILCAVVLIFLPQLLNLFGCTDALREYALKYSDMSEKEYDEQIYEKVYDRILLYYQKKRMKKSEEYWKKMGSSVL